MRVVSIAVLRCPEASRLAATGRCLGKAMESQIGFLHPNRIEKHHVIHKRRFRGEKQQTRFWAAARTGTKQRKPFGVSRHWRAGFLTRIAKCLCEVAARREAAR